MPEERPVVEALLDLVVFAPIGLVLEVVQDLPKLSERGRTFVEKDMTVARMIGRLAVGEARKKVGEAFGARGGDAGAAAGSDVRRGGSGPTGPPSRAAGSAGATGVGADGRASSPTAAGAGRRPGTGRRATRPAEPARPATGGGSPGGEREEISERSDQHRSGRDALVSTARAEQGAASPTEAGGGASGSEGRAPQGAPDVASLAIPGYDTLAASQVVQRLGSLGRDELEAIRRYEVATRGRRTVLHRIAQLSPREGRATA